ncbi:hypothetical protein N656DRAFT_776746 [Canariomyces notabilis]|uniref:Uncharacterized protein n=1 Tax=Canariomyces notabilis TaxID=2074819 RepID=A0AAN6THK2_9PEZI|nr:hypothetical protein N656DRAFT_776746 [Canariomyces arenarius]
MLEAERNWKPKKITPTASNLSCALFVSTGQASNLNDKPAETGEWKVRTLSTHGARQSSPRSANAQITKRLPD